MKKKDRIKAYNPDRMPGRKKNIAGLIFMLLTTAATLFTLSHFADLGEAMRAIGSAKGPDICYAALCLLAYILVFPLCFCVGTRLKNFRTGFWDSYFIGSGEHFFNGITPYQVGAQPFQIYAYTRRGEKASVATGFVLVNFLALLFASNIYVAISMIFAPDLFGAFAGRNMLWIPIIGIIMNLFVMALFICVATCKWVRNLLTGALKKLCGIKFIGKGLSRFIPAFEGYCDRAQAAASEVFSNKGGFLALILLRMIALTFYYSIPYFLLRALGLDGGMSFGYSLLATAFLVNSVVWIPTPGTTGGIEYAFTVVFALQNVDAAASAILWRGFTYYIIMFVSFVMYFTYAAIIKVRTRRGTAKPLRIEYEPPREGESYHDLPDVIDVLMAGDVNVYEGIGMCAVSMAKKTTERPVRLHIMTTFAVGTKGMTREHAAAIERAIKHYNPLNEVRYYDVTEQYDKYFTDSPNAEPMYSPCSMLRLFANAYLDCERLIYLDADTLCLGSLAEFFKVDISEYEMGVSVDFLGKFWMHPDYFNSGVLFVNLPLCKRTGLFERTVELLTRKWFIMADQSALYKCSARRLYLPARYNEQRDIKPDTVVKHFNKGVKWFPICHFYNVKQWHRDKVRSYLKIDCLEWLYDDYDRLIGSGEKPGYLALAPYAPSFTVHGNGESAAREEN